MAACWPSLIHTFYKQLILCLPYKVIFSNFSFQISFLVTLTPTSCPCKAITLLSVNAVNPFPFNHPNDSPLNKVFLHDSPSHNSVLPNFSS